MWSTFPRKCTKTIEVGEVTIWQDSAGELNHNDPMIKFAETEESSDDLVPFLEKTFPKSYSAVAV